MISTVPPEEPGSSTEHRNRLRAMYRAAGDDEMLRFFDEQDRLEARQRAAWVPLALKLAPLAGGAAVVAFSLWSANEPLTNMAHDARVLLVAAGPWIAQVAAQALLS